MKFYTAFVYDHSSDTGVHCTHKYFGELPESKVREVVSMIDSYFVSHDVKRELRVPRFSMVDFFGPRMDTKVMRPADTDLEGWLMGLRGQFDKFAKDSYGPYRPHVTVQDLPEGYMQAINRPFKAYALMSKGRVIKSWPIE